MEESMHSGVWIYIDWLAFACQLAQPNPTAATMQHPSGQHPSGMPVIFFSSTSTPLYSNALTPKNGGQYAGLCIFVVALAMFARLLIAARGVIDASRWRTKSGSTMLSLLERALFDVVVAALGYLLMLVVMTLNVGYFCSVLGGVFIGALVSGNWGKEHEGDWLPC
ncbi:hypothetical protein RB595_002068 [Gaeumannomyces hyphopodioides]